MIVYPKNWTKIGEVIEIKEIEDTILQILSEIDCPFLSFSGGLDSSLMLYYMLKIYSQVYAYTMGSSELHPDVTYSKLVVDKFGDNIVHKVFIPSCEEIKNVKRFPEDLSGDLAVRLFYDFVGKHTNKIIACDGIDEFMCGYYSHQENPCECLYYAYLRQLQESHLLPLHKNSRDVQVFLPFLDSRLLLLFSQIPVSEKVDKGCRKKVLVRMAEDKIPYGVINRRKYGFCDVLKIKT